MTFGSYICAFLKKQSCLLLFDPFPSFLLCPARRQRLRVLLRSFRLRTGIVPQTTELSSWTDLPALGHESVALDKLLSLPETQQLEGAAAGLLLWDNTENEEEDEEQIRVCEIREKTDKLMESMQGLKNIDAGAAFADRYEDKRPPMPVLPSPAR